MTTPLTTSADVKDYLGLTGSGQDALVARLITAASAFIETWLSRTIAVTIYTQAFNGHGGDRLYLPHLPVVSVESVEIGTNVVPAATDAADSGYTHDEDSVYLRGYRFVRGVQNVTVGYTAGLAANVPSDVPADLAQACIELIALKYRRMGDEGMASKHLASETVSFVTTDMPKPVATILGQYKNVVPA